MNRTIHWTLACTLFLASGTSRAHVGVTSERTDASAASEAFTFKNIPAPSTSDAGNLATFSIIKGMRDPAGAGLIGFNDGRLPSSSDDPSRNFFFNVSSTGGRILAEFPEARELTAVHTYSWHPADRGPQVYKLYAADGAAANFNPKPEADPEAAGWKLLADVDTRPKADNDPVVRTVPGGQYAVRIADSAGASLGKFRYLLFQISRTGDAPFSNTFYSEIDLIDGKDHPVAVIASPALPQAPLDVMKIGDKYEVTFDYTETPDLKDWVNTKLKPVCAEWYPKIVELLPSDGYEAPTRFSIKFNENGRGVASASGTRINAAATWFRRNLEGEALGALVHEMVHVVQQYRRVRGGNANPGWMVEGLADYIRWHLYEPQEKRRRLNPARVKYTDSYHVTGAFLAHVEKSNEGFVRKLNAAMREGKYSPDLWKEQTDKTIDEQWEGFIKTLQPAN